MAVSKRTRYEVLKRDNFTCRYCRSTEDELTIDHVVPVALGGTSDPDNLVACCRDCNAGKSSTSPTEGTVEDVRNSDVRWADAIKRAAEVQAAEKAKGDAYVRAFEAAWPRWYIPHGYEPTIRSFYEAGLPIETVKEAIEITYGTRGVEDRFRYFCGVCWKRVRNLQEIAKALLEVDDAGAE